MKKTLLMATLLLASLSYSGDLFAQKQKRVIRRSTTTTTVASPTPKVKKEKLVRGGAMASDHISVVKGSLMERAAQHQRVKGATARPPRSSEPKVKVVKRK